MYAVIETGGKQYRVEKGQKLRVEKLDGKAGDKVEFDRVLLVRTGEGDDAVAVGTPVVSGAKVEAEIVAQARDKKIVVFKFKRRKGYRRKQGHRQHYTELMITGIQA